MPDAAACARCGCDLTLMRGAQAQASRLTVMALQAWVAGDLELAGSRARAALALDRSPLAEVLVRALSPGRIVR